jgi:hypothetical protein
VAVGDGCQGGLEIGEGFDAIDLAGFDQRGDPANNPVSSLSGDRMVHIPDCAAWTWDARPYPFFPELTDVWTDGAN